MSFTMEQIAQLTAPLSSSHVKERTQAGRTLSYIESWKAISEANRIFGFDGWHSNTRVKKLFDAYKDAKDLWRVGYMAKVTVAVKDGEQYVTRDGVGYGSGIDRDLGQAHESALKEAESDARKRALMTFGNPFGLALYDKEQANVTDDEPKTATEAHVAKVAEKMRSDAQPKPAWNGPLKVTELKQKLSALRQDLEAMTDADEFNGTVGDNYPLLRQCFLDLPGWWVNPEGGGARATLTKKGGELKVEMANWILAIENGPAKQAAE